MNESHTHEHQLETSVRRAHAKRELVEVLSADGPTTEDHVDALERFIDVLIETREKP